MFWTPWPQFWRPHWKKICGRSNRRSGRFPKKCKVELFLKEIYSARQSSSGHWKGTFDNPDEKSWWKVLKVLIKCWKWSEKMSFFQKKRIFSMRFFSVRPEFSSFDKLLENVSENSRTKFAQYLEYARIASFVWNNPHSFPPDIWNAVLTTLLKLLAKV